MKIGDLVAYRGQEGSFGLILEQDYDITPPVRGVKFLVKWLDGIGLAGPGGWDDSVDGWFKKESLEIISEAE